MFGTLLETKARRERRPLGTVASVGVHAGVVVLALWGTATAGPPPVAHEVVTTIAPPRKEAPGPVEPRTPGRTRSGGLLPTLPVAPIDPQRVDVAIPTLGPSGPAIPGDSLLLADIGGGGGGATGGGDAGSTGPADEWAVDERVGIVSERAPRYPETLRAAGVEGTVVVRFVVDSSGRVDPASVQVVDSPHEQFTAAVIAALRQTRFVPGKIRGRAVATLVQRSFRFAVEGRP